MRDVFIEEVVENSKFNSEKVKYNVMSVLAIIFLFALITWALSFVIFFPTMLGESFVVKLILNIFLGSLFGVGTWLFFKFRNRFCIEYDYTLVDDSLRIDKVVKRVKRFKVNDFSIKNIDKIGKFGSKTYENFASNQDLDIEFCSPNDMPSDETDFYYLVANTSKGRFVYVLECRISFITTIIKGCRRDVLEADFKWFI